MPAKGPVRGRRAENQHRQDHAPGAPHSGRRLARNSRRAHGRRSTSPCRVVRRFIAPVPCRGSTTNRHDVAANPVPTMGTRQEGVGRRPWDRPAPQALSKVERCLCNGTAVPTTPAQAHLRLVAAEASHNMPAARIRTI